MVRIMRWDLISISEAARILHVHPGTLRYHETPDGHWVEYDGLRFRVYRFDGGQRRYDRREIFKLINHRRKAT